MSGNFCLCNAKLKIFFLPIIQFYRKWGSKRYFSFCLNGNAELWRHRCCKIIIGPCIVQTDYSARDDLLYINHVVEKFISQSICL